MDARTLASIPVQPAPPATGIGSLALPTATRYLSWPKGTFELTAVRDPDDDGSVYITGLPLANLHSTLRDVALAEAAVFSAVLLLAGVSGTFWVRFSLRPLRRVAATASQVAELPLESGEVSLPAGVPDTDPGTETGQVGLAFNRMLGHVETALRRRASSEIRLRRFAADASHELRTPLAAIRGYAELALRHPGDAPEGVTHALKRVLSESTRMSVLVDDLLLLARLDAGRPLNSEPVDMTRLAIDATSDAQVARPGHRWVLELPDEPETRPRRRAPAAAGARQPAVQRRAAHPGRHHGHRPGQQRPAGRRAGQRAPGRPRTERSRPRPGWWSRSPTTAPASRPSCFPTCSSGSPGPTRPARTPPTPPRPGSGSRSSTRWSPPITARCW